LFNNEAIRPANTHPPMIQLDLLQSSGSMAMIRFIPFIALFWTLAAGADEPTALPYQSTGTNFCSTQGDCAVVFPALDSATLVAHVSCNFTLDKDGSIGSASLGTQSGNASNMLPIFFYDPADGFRTYGINAQTYVLYAKDKQPRIDVLTNSGPVQTLICTISGHTV
jgi:hypothetical protein